MWSVATSIAMLIIWQEKINGCLWKLYATLCVCFDRQKEDMY